MVKKSFFSKINEQSAERVKGFFLYSVLWLIGVLIILGIFKENHKLFMWKPDGIYQHFVSFDYLCDYLRSIIYDHQLPSGFNYTIGQGQDILTTLNSYDFTDPVSIFCALVFPLSRIGRYTLMIFVKLYLTGISFVVYCYSIGRNKIIPVTAGAISYVFSGAVIVMYARHPNFINWAYFFPLLLAGVEIYFRKKNKFPMVFIVFWNILTNYYTFYMNAILVAIYVFVLAVYRIALKRSLSSVFAELKRCLKLFGVCCIGIFLSACVLFPTIYAYLSNARAAEVSGYTESLLHYESSYYPKLIESLFSVFKTSAYFTYIGLNAVIIVPLVLILTKKRYVPQKILLLLSFVMLCIPLAGRIMNGFGYATNRWAYAVPFYTSVIFVEMFFQIKKMSMKEKIVVSVAACAYVLFCCFCVETESGVQKYTFVFIAIVVVVSLLSRYYRANYQYIMLFLVVAGAVFQIYYTFSPSDGNYIAQFLNEEEFSASFEGFSSVAAPKSDDEFYRVEMEENGTNIGGRNHTYPTGLWWSMIPSYLLDYYNGLALDTVVQNCYFYDLDARTGLLELASVKYYTKPVSEAGLIPFGYQKMDSSEKSYEVYENQYALPVGYTYSGYISALEYETMNGIEKEQAMLQGTVIDDELSGFDEISVSADYDYLDYEIAKTENVILKDHSIYVKKAAGSISLNVNTPSNCEIYVYLKGIKLPDSKLTNPANLKNPSTMLINVTRKIEKDSVKKMTIMSNLDFAWPVIRDDVTFNLGCGYNGENTITLEFGSVGNLSYDEIQIIAVPMSSYETYAKQLNQYVLENVNVENDKISGDISLPENRILQFSVPYSSGWKAYVDGKEVEIMRSNVMYMALPLSVGNHTVELKYETPYLRLGMIVTCGTIILWVLYEYVCRRKRRKRYE